METGRTPRATADFETRSAADLNKVGAHLYAKHPSTQVLCLAYKLPGMDAPVVWHRAHPGIDESPAELLRPLFDWIAAGGAVEAHNSFFERMIWKHVCVGRMAWPAVPDDQWLCSAAKGSAYSLPRKLEQLAIALDLRHQKDMAGHRTMLKVSKPRRPRKGEVVPEGVVLWNEDPEDLASTWSYCAGDVLAEEEASSVVPDLSPFELQVWRADQRANERGVKIDVRLATAALRMAESAKARMNAELRTITGIEKATQRSALRRWLSDAMLLDLPDTTAQTIEHYLEAGRDVLMPECLRVLTIMRDVNRTSTRKFQRMLDMVDPDDDRVRELLVYCGAERTGRWSGKGIQVQNLAKGDLDPDNGDFPWDVSMDEACADVLTGDLDWCIALYGDVMNLLSSVSRGALVASDSCEFWVADYAAIEARVVLWLAGAVKALDVFRRGEDIYCDMASGIYGRAITKADKKERQFGKQAILGLGYGMGYITFLLTCRKYGIRFSVEDVLRIMGAKRMAKYEAWVRNKLLLPGNTVDMAKLARETRREVRRNQRRLLDARENLNAIVHELALMKYTVDVYRARYPEVPAMWKAQEAAAVEAVQTRARVECGRVAWFVEGRSLHCELPSGRRLSYVDAFLKSEKTSWGEPRLTLRYYGMGQVNKKWSRQATYGGKQVENITQASARDVMAYAFVAADEGFVYTPVMTVHDELVAEAPVGVGVLEEYEALMARMPPAFDGCPIVAEAKVMARYRK
jgi:DNA polymerase